MGGYSLTDAKLCKGSGSKEKEEHLLKGVKQVKIFPETLGYVTKGRKLVAVEGKGGFCKRKRSMNCGLKFWIEFIFFLLLFLFVCSFVFVMFCLFLPLLQRLKAKVRV